MARYRVIEFPKLESTNHFAGDHLRELADGDVIQAEIQTAGRGRWERKWVSHIPGNLCLSLVLKPAGPPAALPLASLSQLLAVCTCQILESHGVSPTLKWPNDVQVSGRKIAGILAESRSEGEAFLGLILGIGVNLNLSPATLESIDQPATALNLELNRQIHVADFRDALLAQFFDRYEPFLAAGFPMIRAQYRQRCSFLGQMIKVRSPKDSCQGIARNITAEGELDLEFADGRHQTLTQGEIVNPTR